MTSDSLEEVREGLLELGATEGDDIGVQVVEAAAAIKATSLSVLRAEREDGSARTRVRLAGGTQNVELWCEAALLGPLVSRMAAAPRTVGELHIELIPDGRSGVIGWCLDEQMRKDYPRPAELKLPNAAWLERTLLSREGISHGLILVGAPTQARLTQVMGAVIRAARSPSTNTVVIRPAVSGRPLPWASMIQVNDVPSAMRAALRQEPDVLIAEGTLDALPVAMTAAQSGRLVVLGVVAASLDELPTADAIHTFWSGEDGAFTQWLKP